MSFRSLRLGLASYSTWTRPHLAFSRNIGSTMSPSALPTVVASDLEKPLLDNRQYRVIRLANQLEALIIHDPETDKGAAALDVNVGSYSDPSNLYGLAHFCEHLLFMGTDKYPSENEYSQYLNDHCGHSNAYTASEETNYFFDVAHEHLEGALDRFAQFFIGPLFSKDCKDREIMAVDSENKKNLQNDSWRLHQLDRSLSNPDHPYNKFSTGNLQTLAHEPTKQGLDVRDELLKFYQSHYSANLMKLVVLGREDLDTLQNWVQEKFAAVRNINRPYGGESEIADKNVVPLTSRELGKMIRAKPVMDTRHLVLTFPVPDQRPVYQTQPSHYFSHLIGHEGPGSLLYYFKYRGWATSLSAGSEHVIKGTDFFLIDVELTPEGLDNYSEILVVIFEYLRLLISTPPQKWMFDEIKVMTEVDFKYRQKTSATDATSRLASAMQRHVPREHVLSSSVIREYQPELITEFAQHLVPSNFRFLLTGQSLDGLESKEKWYGTEYSATDIEPTLAAKLEQTLTGSIRSDLHLPAKNDFIPTNFDVIKKKVDEPLKHPVLLKESDQMLVWHKKDDTFWIPKARVHIKLTNPFATMTPSNTVKTSMFVRLVNDALVDFAYAAEVAGLRYEVSTGKAGIEILVSGYNHKLSVLVERILDKIRNFHVDEDRFKVLKAKAQRANANFGYTVPYNQIGQYTSFLLNEHVWHIDEKSVELDSLEVDVMPAYISDLLRQMQIEILSVGNISKEETLRIADLTVEILRPKPLAASQRGLGRSYVLPKASAHYYEYPLKDEKNINSCIDYTIQVGDIRDSQLRLSLELLAQIASEPIFNQLRTKEQLGYVVFGGVRSTRTTMGYRVLVQSERTTDYLEGRIDAFLTRLGEIITSLSEEDFQTHVQAVTAEKLEKNKNLSEEDNRFWGSIHSGYYDFLRRADDVKRLKSVTKEDVLKLYSEFVDPASPARSKLVVHLKSQSPPQVSQEAVITASVVSVAGKHKIDFDEKAMVEVAAECQGKDLPGVVEVITAKLKERKVSDAAVHEFITDVQTTAAQQLAVANSVAQSKYPDGIAIEDVGQFKSRLTLSEAPTPVVDLSAYLETGAKL